MIVNVKFHSCLNHTPLTFTLPPSLKLRPSLNPLIEKSVLKTMDQDWVTFYFLSGSHLWLILTSVFVIKQSAQRPCWPVPSLLLIFPPKLFFFAKRLLSPTLLDAPAAPRQSLSGLRWGCVRAVSALIPTERQDVIHKQGRGWRRIIFLSSGLDWMGQQWDTRRTHSLSIPHGGLPHWACGGMARYRVPFVVSDGIDSCRVVECCSFRSRYFQRAWFQLTLYINSIASD